MLQATDWTGVEAVYCGGDLVGYGLHPNEVCALIEGHGIPTIYSNYDFAIARDLDDCGCAYRHQHDRELGQRSVEWTLQHTTRRWKDFMRGLPFDLRFELGDQRLRLLHGSPRKVNEYLSEDKPTRSGPSSFRPASRRARSRLDRTEHSHHLALPRRHRSAHDERRWFVRGQTPLHPHHRRLAGRTPRLVRIVALSGHVPESGTPSGV